MRELLDAMRELMRSLPAPVELALVARRPLKLGAPVALVALTPKALDDRVRRSLLGEIVFVQDVLLDGLYEGIRISDGEPCCFFVDDYEIEECG